MKTRVIYVLLIIIIITGIGFYLFLKPKYTLAETIVSPHKEYVLKVYKESNFSHIGLSNQNSYKLAYVVLKNYKGEIIASPRVFKPCRFTIGDLNVLWKTDKVYFTYKNYIDINTGKYYCI
ncbi:MAG: hypothetical protein ACPG44_05015 [Polaribacter sp.]